MNLGMDLSILDLLSKRALTENEHQLLNDYVNGLKSNLSSWQFCIHILSDTSLVNGNSVNARFIALQVLQHHIESWCKMPPKERLDHRILYIKALVMMCQSCDKSSSLLLNKAAYILKEIFVVDYPSNWPTFKDDIMEFWMPNNNQPIYFYKIVFILRFFIEIHNTIGDRTVDRCSIRLKRDEILKDTLKSDFIPDFIPILLKIVETFANKREILLAIIEIISGFCYWIDFTCFFTQPLMNCLFNLLTMEPYIDPVLGCLASMCEKGMPLVTKLPLITYVITRLLESNLISNELIICGGPAYQIPVAKFINTIGLVLCDYLKTETKNDKNVYNDTVEQAITCTNQFVKLAINFIQSANTNRFYEDMLEDDPPIIIVGSFLLEFAVVFKKILKYDWNMDVFNGVFESLISTMLSPECIKFEIPSSNGFVNKETTTDGTMGDELYQTSGDDTSNRFYTHREFSKKIMNNLIYFNDTYYYEKVSQFIYETITNIEKHKLNQVELALYLHLNIFEFYSKAKLSQLEESHNTIIQAAYIIIVKNNIISLDFPIAIKFSIMNVLIRYATLNFNDNFEVFMATEQIFESQYGIYSNNILISDRSCYLLSKLLKAYRKDLLPDFIYTTTLPNLISLYQSLVCVNQVDYDRKSNLSFTIINIILRNKQHSTLQKFSQICNSILEPLVVESERLLQVYLSRGSSSHSKLMSNGSLDASLTSPISSTSRSSRVSTTISTSTFTVVAGIDNTNILLSNLDLMNQVLRLFKSNKDLKHLNSESIFDNSCELLMSCLGASSNNMIFFEKCLKTLKSYIEFAGLSTMSLQKSLFDVSANLNIDQLILMHPLVVTVLPLLKRVSFSYRVCMLSSILSTMFNFFCTVKSNPSQIQGAENLEVYQNSFCDLLYKMLFFDYHDVVFEGNGEKFVFVLRFISEQCQDCTCETLQKTCYLILAKLSFILNVEKFFHEYLSDSTIEPFMRTSYTLLLTPCFITPLDGNFNKLAGTHINMVYREITKVINNLTPANCADIACEMLVQAGISNKQAELLQYHLKIVKSNQVHNLIKAFYAQILNITPKFWNEYIKSTDDSVLGLT